MAVETGLTLRLGTDYAYVFHIKNEALTASVDASTWALSFMVKRKLSDADLSALITKTTVSGIGVAGTYNSAPATNAQRATVTLTDTDSSLLSPGLGFWELKRMDDGFETVLGYGRIEMLKAVHIA